LPEVSVAPLDVADQFVDTTPADAVTLAGGRAVLDSIIHGDALEALRGLTPESVHLMITSPPYNLEIDYAEHDDDLEDDAYLDWMGQVWAAAKDVLVEGGRLCINIGENKRQDISMPTYAAFIQQCVKLGMLYRGTVIWNKNSAAKHCAWGSWKSCSNPHIVPRHEYILVFSKGQFKLEGDKANVTITDKEFMDTTRSVWSFGTESKKRIGHPAPFPEALPDRLLKYYSYRGNIVLDMFGGSGTVGVVAARLGRHFIHIDNSREYCRLAQQRIKTETGARPKIVKV
jgi:modification methylase